MKVVEDETASRPTPNSFGFTGSLSVSPVALASFTVIVALNAVCYVTPGGDLSAGRSDASVHGSRIVAVLPVTPNGPWGKDVHPSMPVSIDDLVTELRACVQAGATGVHLHVRDQSGAETLDPSAVNETCTRVREVAADGPTR